MLKKLWLSLLFLSYLTAQVAVQAADLTIVTEDLPPLQINNNSKPATGAMIEVVNLLLKEAKLTADIHFYPWARSYKIAQEKKNTLIFSIFRDETREPYFQWIGKIFTLESFLVTLKSRPDIHINNLYDAKRYTVGSIREDLAETYLRDKGFVDGKNLYLNSHYKELWKMLYKGRTDLAFTNSTWAYEIKNSHLDPKQIKILYKIPDITSDIYLAASPNTDKSMIKRLQQALATIKKDGRYQKILAKWQL